MCVNMGYEHLTDCVRAHGRPSASMTMTMIERPCPAFCILSFCHIISHVLHPTHTQPTHPTHTLDDRHIAGKDVFESMADGGNDGWDVHRTCTGNQGTDHMGHLHASPSPHTHTHTYAGWRRGGERGGGEREGCGEGAEGISACGEGGEQAAEGAEGDDGWGRDGGGGVEGQV